MAAQPGSSLARPGSRHHRSRRLTPTGLSRWSRARLGDVPRVAFLALASFATVACGLDFDKFDPGASPEDGSAAMSDATQDSASTPGPDGAQGGSVDARVDGLAGVDALAGRDAPSGCSTDSDCSSPSPRCNTRTSHCVQCLTNADCPGASGGGATKCFPASDQCVQCLTSSDCPPGKMCSPSATCS